VINLHLNNDSCLVEYEAKDMIEFDYINWKGIEVHRKVESQRIIFGSTTFHPEPQWLLEGLDLDKWKVRLFAMKDMSNVRHY
jgi:hypothetical protein